MKPRIKIGLIAGAIGLVVTLIVAMVMGICGPFVALLTGVAAGFFALQQETVADKRGGASVGAISGGVAGALILIGQIGGGLAALFLISNAEISTLMGSAPGPNATASEQLIYYAAGLGTGLCFGIVGIAAAALGGAAAGYVSAKPDPELSPPVE